MDHSNKQEEIPVAYPYPLLMEEHNAPQVVAPPPLGYPTKDGEDNLNQQNVETQSRGGGGDNSFWKGCASALCCCCLLDFFCL